MKEPSEINKRIKASLKQKMSLLSMFTKPGISKYAINVFFSFYLHKR